MGIKPNSLTDNQRVLVTGGAGFIGSHLVDLLLSEGYQVGILDNFNEQIHGRSAILEERIPNWTAKQIAAGAALFVVDVVDKDGLTRAIEEFRPTTIVHLAAEVGVGQAEHEVARYVRVNVLGTANLVEAILHANDTLGEGQELDGVRRLICAGSMSSYGEGLYYCPDHHEVRGSRLASDILDQQFDVPCRFSFSNRCEHRQLPVIPIPEWSSFDPGGIYALTKRDTEEITLNARRTMLSCASLRLFNVIGPRQSLGNPYTGVAAIFAARCLSGLAPRVYEDGNQVRDFVHVRDVVEAFKMMLGPPQIRLALRMFANESYQGAFNVASGKGTTIAQVAKWACEELAPELEPEITLQARVGDVRSCIGDASKLTQLTGWSPLVPAEVGLRNLFRELSESREVYDHDILERAHNALVERRLVLSTEVPTEEEIAEHEVASSWQGPIGTPGVMDDAPFEDQIPD